MTIIIDWNGHDLPPDLRTLPKGRYVLESLDKPEPLSSTEEAGVEAAIRSARAGRTIGLDEAVSDIKERLKR
jgi:hypothetical protein